MQGFETIYKIVADKLCAGKFYWSDFFAIKVNAIRSIVLLASAKITTFSMGTHHEDACNEVGTTLRKKREPPAV